LAGRRTPGNFATAKDIEQIGELFGPEYHSVWTGNEISGTAIVSRWPIRERAELALAAAANEPGSTALRVNQESGRRIISACLRSCARELVASRRLENYLTPFRVFR